MLTEDRTETQAQEGSRNPNKGNILILISFMILQSNLINSWEQKKKQLHSFLNLGNSNVQPLFLTVSKGEGLSDF